MVVVISAVVKNKNTKDLLTIADPDSLQIKVDDTRMFIDVVGNV